jgi:hypothetical protein
MRRSILDEDFYAEAQPTDSGDDHFDSRQQQQQIEIQVNTSVVELNF